MFNGAFEVKMNDKQEICISGRIDLNNVLRIQAEINPLLQKSHSICINLAEIKSVDSSSLALLVECIRYAKREHKEIMLSNMPQFMLDLGRVCGLDIVFPINKPIYFH